MSEFLKCDAEGCDHIENVDAITSEMVGKPCPICGANLLTQEDWMFYRDVLRPSMDMMTKLGLSRPAALDDPDHLTMRVSGHQGELHIKLPGNPA